MNSFEEKMVVAAVAALGLLYVYKKYIPAVPQVVKDGVEAGAVLTEHAANTVLHPLDTFGISPIQSGQGPSWIRTTPQDNPDDVVSNGAGGMNFNSF